MLEKIINITLYILQLYYILQILKAFLAPREGKLQKLLLFLIMINMMGINVYPNEIESIFLYLAAFSCVIFVFYHGKSIKKISAILFFYPILLTINYLTEDIGYNIWLANRSMSLWQQTILHSLTVLLRVPFWFLIYRFFLAYIKTAAKFLTLRMWLILDLVCLSSFIGIMTILYFAPKQHIYTYPACIACLLTNLGCFFLSAYISKRLQAELELKTLNYQKAYYGELEKNQEKIRRIRHDMKNHMLVLSSLLKDCDYEKAHQYLNKLTSELTTPIYMFCKNHIMNALLNVKYQQALQNGIDCNFFVELQEIMEIDDLSLCSLFSNTLDNAIEACLKIQDMKKRCLRLSARYSHGHFSYSIVNSKENQIIEKNGKIQTEKEDKRSHGIGIASVREIVENYSGSMEITYTDESFSVVIYI